MELEKQNTLVVLVGPTGIGKTELSLSLAEHLGTSIISSDSRQIYKGTKIGTAAPTPSQLQRVPHHFVAIKELEDYYNAFEFEKGVLHLLKDLFQEHPIQMMVGGSMMYVDAVCKGIDEIPDIDPQLRQDLKDRLEEEGLDPLRKELKKLDPELYNEIDLKNPKRILHALEVCFMTGKPYSSFRSNKAKERDFNILKIGLNMDRAQLYDRINLRVDQMIEEGLEEEARQFFHLRHLNSLNTVGYKEMFEFIEGKIDLERARELIKRNTRRYAKKQLTWFKRDPDITWFQPQDKTAIFQHVDEFLTSHNLKKQ